MTNLPKILLIIGMTVMLWSCRSELPPLLPESELVTAEAPVREKILDLHRQVRSGVVSPQLLGSLGITYYVHDFRPFALPLLERAAGADPGQLRWPYYHAIIREELGGDPTAELGKCLEIDPNYLPLLFRYGRALLRHQEPERAREIFFRILGRDEHFAFAHLELGRMAADGGNTWLAGKHLRAALGSIPRFREAYGLLGTVYRMEDKPDSVLWAAKESEGLAPKTELPDPLWAAISREGVSSLWCKTRGLTYLSQGRYREAEEAFRQALDARRDAEGYNDLGMALQYQERWEAAEEAFGNALEKDSLNPEIINNLGVVCYRTGRTLTAIKLAQKARSLSPEFPDVYLNLGTYFREMRRYSEARDAFEKGLVLAEEDLRFAYQLSWLLASAPENALRDGPRALELAQQVANRSGSGNPSVLDALAAAYAETGQFARAVESAGRARMLALSQGRDQLAGEIALRIKGYESGRAYREPGKPAGGGK
ncbi:MAG TPA: tetratricopeptide repeat protein [Calditrichia bacterium]|nr:tetratricopeptide repeat protein [Calditrichia bacterium]